MNQSDVTELHEKILDIYRGGPTTMKTAGHAVDISVRDEGGETVIGYGCTCGKDQCGFGIGAAKIYAAAVEAGIAIGNEVRAS
jgi:hypothetical protein